MPLNSQPSSLSRTQQAMPGRKEHETAVPRAAQSQKGLAVTEIREPGPDQAVAAGSGLPMSAPRPASASGRAR
jgi:hypothetical protein